MNFSETPSMTYDIYPCDLDCYGERPKPVQDCKACRGWTQAEADVLAAIEERKEQEYLALEGMSE